MRCFLEERLSGNVLVENPKHSIVSLIAFLCKRGLTSQRNRPHPANVSLVNALFDPLGLWGILCTRILKLLTPLSRGSNRSSGQIGT
jgi:hypothetical protein